MQAILQNRMLNIAAFALTIVVNGLANGIPLGGQTTGEVSAKYPSLFTPAGFTFSIWGLIYLSLAVFVVWQALPAQRDNSTIDKIGPLFKLNCIANAIWIFTWHYELLFLSLFLMALILITLIGIYRTLADTRVNGTVLEFIALCFPFSLYTAWITVATIANLSAVQIGMGWDDVLTDSVTWTLIKLAIAGAIGATIILRKSDYVFGLVVAWAAYGISAKQAAVPAVAGSATTLALLAVLLIAIQFIVRPNAK